MSNLQKSFTYGSTYLVYFLGTLALHKSYNCSHVLRSTGEAAVTIDANVAAAAPLAAPLAISAASPAILLNFPAKPLDVVGAVAVAVAGAGAVVGAATTAGAGAGAGAGAVTNSLPVPPYC